jgi:ATP-dependent exoDNAse (exonuclease V) beta subunit
MTGRPESVAGETADHQARLLSQTVFDRPLVLEAGAGTGKTATLVARLIAWCLGPGWRRAARELEAHEARAVRREVVGTDRIAARVLDGVVAITFTEAAAAEMADRVASALVDVQRGALPNGLLAEGLGGAAGDERERASALLVALDHLLVATIHAFCRRLLAGVPLEAGLHPNFTVDAEGLVLAEVVQEIVETAFRRALAASEGGPLFALAARGVDPLDVAKALVKLAGDGVPAAAFGADPLGPTAVGSLIGRLRARAEAVHRLIGGRLGGAGRTKNAAAIAGGVETILRALADEGRSRTLAEVNGAVEGALGEALLRHLEKWGRDELTTSESAVLDDVRAALPAAARDLAGLARQLRDLDPELLDLARRALAPLLAEVHRTMRARGAQTFAALLRDAAETLARHPQVRSRVRGEITQLLVDEFQDTDRRQCEILRLLALEGSPEERPGLFLIGDPKQSIYGWRDADLAAYDGFLALVREAGGRVMSLSVNFRSTPAILAEVDRVVRPAMRAEPGMQPAFQALLPCARRSLEPDPLAGRRAPVEYWVSWAPSTDAPDVLEEASTQEAAELEAVAVAADIRELHEGGVPWRGFGVLLRSTGDIDVYLQAFRDAGVPYLVERDRAYYRRREIIDAAALVRAVLDPGDHLALVTVLRSSAVGVPDAALIPLWARSFPDRVSELGPPTGGGLAEVQALVIEVAATLPADIPGIERIRGWERNLVAFLGHLVELRASFATEPSASFVEKLRVRTLFEATEAARNLGGFRVANLDRFFRTLLDAIESAGDPHAVLRSLRAGVSEVREAEEGRPLAATEDAVRVMTIHKAKGLDFTHVILVQAQKRSRRERRASTDAEEIAGRFEYVLFGAATPGWHAVEERRRRVGEAELVRTLYVAMTRARDRLVVAGVWPSAPPAHERLGSHMDLLARRQTPEGGLPAAAAALRAAGAAHLDGAAVRWVFPALRPAAPGAAPSEPAPELPSPADVGRQAERLARLEGEAQARQARAFGGRASEEAHRRLREVLAEERPEGPSGERDGLERSPATAAGSAVHQVLENLDLGGDLAAGLSRARERLPDVLAGLTGGAWMEESVERARSILDRLARSRILTRLAAVAPTLVARELPVLLPPDGGPGAPVGFVSGTIDLVYREGRGELVIVDYKTDDVATEQEIATRVAAYAAQGEVYRRALREALGLASDPRFELWFLTADRIVEVPR